MACLLSYVSSAPFIFIEFFGLSEQQFGWVFGSNALGLILGSQINRLALKRFSLLQITVATCLALSVLTTGGIAISFLALQFWVVYPFLFVMLFLVGFQNPNVTALSLDPFNKQAGSASALVGSIGMIFGSLASILVAQLVTESVAPLLYILFCSALCSLVLVLFYLNKRKLFKAQTSKN